MKTKLIALFFALALVAGCTKDEPERTPKRNARKVPVYRDTTDVDTIVVGRVERSMIISYSNHQ